MSIAAHRRMINDDVGSLFVHKIEEQGVVELRDSAQNVLISVNELAQDALEFIANTKGFYVRELLGDLTEDEQIGLVTVLAQCRCLRVAP